MGRGAADLEWAGNQQSYTLDRVRAAEAEAARAADAAAAAKEKAEDAERRGRIAKERADGLVAQQRALVAALAEKARSTRSAAAKPRTRQRRWLVPARSRPSAGPPPPASASPPYAVAKPFVSTPPQPAAAPAQAATLELLQR